MRQTSRKTNLIGSRGNTSDSDDQFSDDNAVRSSPNTKKTGTRNCCNTVKREMFNQEISEEVAAELLQCYQH